MVPPWPRLLVWPCDFGHVYLPSPLFCDLVIKRHLLIVLVGERGGRMQAKALGTVIADITLHRCCSHSKQLLDACCA